MNKHISKALRLKANELSTKKKPEMVAKFTRKRKPSAKEGEVLFEKMMSLKYHKDTTNATYRRLKTWWNSLPKNERTIERINKLEVI